MKRAVLAGCRSIEHGALIDQPTLDLMAAHGTYFDPNIDLVFRNYFENQAHFLGIGNYTAEGFAQMRNAVPKALDVFKRGLMTKGLKMVFGNDAVAGSHGRGRERRPVRALWFERVAARGSEEAGGDGWKAEGRMKARLAAA